MKPHTNPPRKKVPPPETKNKIKGVPEIERAKHTGWSLTSREKENRLKKMDKNTEGNLINIIRSTIEDAIDNKLSEKIDNIGNRDQRAMSTESSGSESDVNSETGSDVKKKNENGESGANNVGGRGVGREKSRKLPSLSRSRQRSSSEKRRAQEVESDNKTKDSPKKQENIIPHDLGCACAACQKKRSTRW